MTATYKDIGVSIAGHVGQIEIQRGGEQEELIA